MVFETVNTSHCFVWSQIMTIINYMLEIPYMGDYSSTCQESFP